MLMLLNCFPEHLWEEDGHVGRVWPLLDDPVEVCAVADHVHDAHVPVEVGGAADLVGAVRPPEAEAGRPVEDTQVKLDVGETGIEFQTSFGKFAQNSVANLVSFRPKCQIRFQVRQTRLMLHPSLTSL